MTVVISFTKSHLNSYETVNCKHYLILETAMTLLAINLTNVSKFVILYYIQNRTWKIFGNGIKISSHFNIFILDQQSIYIQLL